jgi:short subunit dehydrogenase-like uncharacterized protein
MSDTIAEATTAQPPVHQTFDVILWGATGFTGQLVADAFARRLADRPEVRWAIAGRSQAKLEAVRAALVASYPTQTALTSLPILIADSNDLPSLRALAAQARVVCSTVGPYAQYGSDLVAACVAERASYCDLTGEVHWMRKMIDAHHAEATANGVQIVHACGFDSIPSDLGVLTLQQLAQETFGSPCTEVVLAVTRSKGGISGGTIASMLNTIEQVRANPSLRKVLGDPYSLRPEGHARGPRVRDQSGPKLDPLLGRWTAPFLMGPVNTRVVRRSNALLGDAYGAGFLYREVVQCGKGIKGALASGAISGAIGGVIGALLWAPTRKLMTRYALPAPGEGPTPEVIASGFFEMRLVGRGADANGAPFEVRCDVKGQRDPGYGATADMLSEAALCLALDHPYPHGGVLTPAVALGATLVERLRDRGFVFNATIPNPQAL